MSTTCYPSFKEIYLGDHSTVREVNFRDSNMFVPAEVHNHLEALTVIMQYYQDGEIVLGFILEFLRPFREF